MAAGLTLTESAAAHIHCLPGQSCSIVAGFLGQTSGNPNSWGSAEEEAAKRLFSSWDLTAYRHPRPGFYDADDTQVVPDLGIDMVVSGARSFPCGQSGTFSVFIDVKAQERDGSVKEKLEHTIRSYAAHSDATGTVSHIAHLMCPAVVGHGFMSLMSHLADREGVGFFDLATLTKDAFIAHTNRIASVRQRTMSNDDLREVVADLGVTNLAAALRLALRDSVTGSSPEDVPSDLNDSVDLFTASHQQTATSSGASRGEASRVQGTGKPEPSSGVDLLSGLL